MTAGGRPHPVIPKRSLNQRPLSADCGRSAMTCLCRVAAIDMRANPRLAPDRTTAAPLGLLLASLVGGG